jgi:dTDP-4-amino-4,6-dideoxy-D-galactose acyltransferase
MTGAAPAQFLPWDSHFFGRRIARLKPSVLRESILKRALRWCAKERIDCLYFLGRGGDPATLRLADRYQFQFVDSRVTLDLDLSKIRPGLTGPTEPRLSSRLATSLDEPALRAIAAGSYSESRFAMDAHFPKQAHRRMFQEWIVQSIGGHFDDCVWVAEWNRRIAGYISCRQSSRTAGRIGLVGIGERFRGRHVGAFLIAQALDWFRQKHLSAIEVATQGCNIPAQRLYEQCGFRTRRLDLWYHKWF